MNYDFYNPGGLAGCKIGLVTIVSELNSWSQKLQNCEQSGSIHQGVLEFTR